MADTGRIHSSRHRTGRRGARLVALLALALLVAPPGVAATPAPAAAPLGPADLLAQARQADLVLVAIAAAAAGRDLPNELSPQIREDIARRIAVDTSSAGPAHLTAFTPLVPVHWERVPPFGERAPSPTADTATLRARLLGTVTVAHDATPGRPVRVAQRPLARQLVSIDLARRDGRWVVTRITVNTASGTLAQ